MYSAKLPPGNVPTCTLLDKVVHDGGKFDVVGRPGFRLEHTQFLEREITLRKREAVAYTGQYEDNTQAHYGGWAAVGIQEQKIDEDAHICDNERVQPRLNFPLNHQLQTPKFVYDGAVNYPEYKCKGSVLLNQLLSSRQCRDDLQNNEFPSVERMDYKQNGVLKELPIDPNAWQVNTCLTQCGYYLFSGAFLNTELLFAGTAGDPVPQDFMGISPNAVGDLNQPRLANQWNYTIAPVGQTEMPWIFDPKENCFVCFGGRMALRCRDFQEGYVGVPGAYLFRQTLTAAGGINLIPDDNIFYVSIPVLKTRPFDANGLCFLDIPDHTTNFCHRSVLLDYFDPDSSCREIRQQDGGAHLVRRFHSIKAEYERNGGVFLLIPQFCIPYGHTNPVYLNKWTPDVLPATQPGTRELYYLRDDVPVELEIYRATVVGYNGGAPTLDIRTPDEWRNGAGAVVAAMFPVVGADLVRPLYFVFGDNANGNHNRHILRVTRCTVLPNATDIRCTVFEILNMPDGLIFPKSLVTPVSQIPAIAAANIRTYRPHLDLQPNTPGVAGGSNPNIADLRAAGDFPDGLELLTLGFGEQTAFPVYPYKRVGFTQTLTEPLLYGPSNQVMECLPPMEEKKQFYPLLIQDFELHCGVSSTMPLRQNKPIVYDLTQNQMTMVLRSQNDVDQRDKMLSKINQRWIHFEEFHATGTGDLRLEAETRFGLPEYFLIYVDQETPAADNYWTERDLYSEIQTLEMKIFHKTNKLFSVAAGRDLIETSRRNLHKYSQYKDLPPILFFKLSDLGSMDRLALPPTRERLVFEITVSSRKNMYSHTQLCKLHVAFLRDRFLVGDANRMEFIFP